MALQMYGPNTTWWSYPKYVEAAQAALAYGIPQNKLIMGLPFFGTTGVAGEQVGYRDLVSANPNLNFDTDQVMYNGKNYTFNGVTTIINKTQYVCQNELGGIMAWDIPLDMLDYNSSHSLLRAAIETLNSCNAESKVVLNNAMFSNQELIVDWQLENTSGIDYCIIEYSSDSTNFYQLDSISIKSEQNESLKQFSTKVKLTSLIHSVNKTSISTLVLLLLIGFGYQLVRKRRRIGIPLFLITFILSFHISSCQKREVFSVPSSKEKAIKFIRIKAVNNEGESLYSDIKMISK